MQDTDSFKPEFYSNKFISEVGYMVGYGYARDTGEKLNDQANLEWLAKWFNRQADSSPRIRAEACGIVDALSDILIERNFLPNLTTTKNI